MYKQNILKASTSCLFFITIKATVYAQSILGLNGMIISDTNKGIPSATIELISMSTKKILSTQTDSLGKFKFSNLERGPYKLLAKSISYEPQNVNIFINEKPNDILLVLNSTTQQLGEVVVQRKKPLIEQKIDRYIYNLSASISGTFGDASQALKSVPGLQVTDDNIKIVGKSSVKVLVNGRDIGINSSNLNDYLKTIQSSDIKSIEVITNPSSKYEAEGNSGAINIVLKSSSLSELLAVNFNTSYQRGKRNSNNNAVTVNHNFNKFQNTYSASYNMNNTEGDYILDYIYSDSRSRENNIFGVNNKPLNFSLFSNYKINEKITTGLRVTLNSNRKHSTRDNNRNFYTENSLDSILLTTVDDRNRSKSLNAGYYTELILDTNGSKLNFEVSYYNNKNNRDYIFESITKADISHNYLPVSTEGTDRSKLYFGQIDYYKVFKHLELEGGIKYSVSKIDNQFLYRNKPNATYADSYVDYNEKNLSAYISGGAQFGEWNIQGGIRAENFAFDLVSLSLQEFVKKKTIFQIFPSFNLSKKLDEKNTMILSYGRRVGRPSYKQIDPFIEYFSPLNYRKGNPDLIPYFTNNFELKHNFKNTLITTLYYSTANNTINDLQIINKDNYLTGMTFANYIDSRNIGLTESFNIAPFPFWEHTTLLQLYYNKFFSNNPTTPAENKGFAWYGYTNNNFKISNKLGSYVAFSIYGPQQVGVVNTKVQSSFDLGISWKLIDKQLTVNAKVSDLFKGSKMRYATFSNTVLMNGTTYNDTRRFMISASYSLGKAKKSNKTLQGDENINRVGK